MEEGGVNCPLDNVITTESKCISAANQLQIRYRESLSDPTFTVGCFVHRSRNEVWFNTFMNASETYPDKSANGICVTGILVYLIHQIRL